MFPIKNKIIPIIFATIFLPALNSCNASFFPEFKVENSAIDTTKALMIFSAPVNPISIKTNFFFTEDGNTVNGEFAFFGNLVSFTPENGITDNHCYEIFVYTGAEDNDGNSLEEIYYRKFHTKTDLSRPTVLHIENITKNSGQIESLKIIFSKKMNEVSFNENFSIEPNAEFITKWNDTGDTVELIFKKELTEKTFYAVKIGANTKDIQNNLFAKEFTWSFENMPNYKSPDFSVSVFNYNTETYQEISNRITTENIDFRKGIEIRFNKKIDSDKFLQGIFVEPNANYKIETPLSDSSNFSDCTKIIFTEQVLWNTTYRLFVSNAITDNYGTPIAEKSFVLKNNSEKLRPPKFEFLLIKVGNEYKTLSSKNNYCDLSFAPEIYQPEYPDNIPLYFIFRISEDSQTIDEVSAMKAINVSPQNSCIKFNLLNMKICSYNDTNIFNDALLCQTAENSINELGVEGNLVCIKFDTQFYNNENGSKIIKGLIDFKIAKTLCDNNKNFMEEAVQVSCNKM